MKFLFTIGLMFSLFLGFSYLSVSTRQAAENVSVQLADFDDENSKESEEKGSKDTDETIDISAVHMCNLVSSKLNLYFTQNQTWVKLFCIENTTPPPEA